MSASDSDLALNLKNLRILVSEKIKKKRSAMVPKPSDAGSALEQNFFGRLISYIQNRDDLK